MKSSVSSRRKALRGATAPIIEFLESRQYLTAIAANFDNGYGTTSADQYVGTSGSGWHAGWQTSAVSSSFTTATIASSSPLTSGGGNYVSATMTASSSNARAVIGRGYDSTGNVSVTGVHEVQMDFRVDSSLSTFTAANDKVNIFGADKTQFAPLTNDTILAQAQGAANGAISAKHWTFVDGSTNVDSGITLTQGTVYHFTFVIDTSNDQYTAYISDGTAGSGHTYQSGTLAWGNSDSFGPGDPMFVNIGGRVDGTSESLSFSFDNVKVTPPPPTAPSGLSISTISGSELDLSWTDNSSTETGFVIDRATNSGFTTGLTSTTVSANTTTLSSTGLSSGTTYYYRVQAINEGGVSSYVTGNGTTSGSAPAAPSGLSATAASTTQINLAWTDNSSTETGFIIKRSTDDTTWTTVTTTSANVTSYNDTGLSPSTLYYYQVSATNSSGNSTNTTASATTQSESSGSSIIVANFDDGNGTASADQYLGVAGDGWTGPWHTANAASSFTTATVVNTSPLTVGGGNYLSATLTASGSNARGAVSRGYTSLDNVDVTGILQLQMDYRVDSALTTFTNINDKILIFGDTAAHFAPIDGTDTQLAVVQGAAATGLAARDWGFNDGDGAGGTDYVDSGVSLAQGTVYHLTFLIDAPNHRYTATISDGLTGTGHTYTSGWLGWDNNDTLTTTNHPYIEAGARMDGTSESISFSMDNIKITPPPPAAPSGLSVTTVSSSQLGLSWTDNSSTETGFVIDRATNSGFTTGLTSTTVSANTTTLSSSGLTSGTGYYYRVKAVDEGGDSSWLTGGPFTPGSGSPVVPADPTGLTITSTTSGQINVAWTDNATNETGYTLDWSTLSNFSTITGSSSLSSNATTGSAISLSADTTYYLRVKATNSAGSSGYATNNATTLPNAPTAPSGLDGSASSPTSVALTWTDNSSNETGFKLDRKTGSGGTYSQIASPIANATSATDSLVSEGTDYFYEIAAINTGGDSSFSSPKEIITPLNAPTALTATTVSDTQIGLSWTDNSSNESGYILQWSKVSDFSTIAGFTNPTTNATTASVTSLTAGTLYYFRLKATNTVAESGYATTSGTTSGTAPIIPTAPTSLSATAISSSQADLSWTDNSSDETGFIVYLQDDNGDFNYFDEVAANVTTYQATGLDADKAYTFKVAAENSSSVSGMSNSASATTSAIAAPSGLSATVVSSTEIDLNWADNSFEESGYDISWSTDGTTFNNLAELAADTTQYHATTLTPGTTYSFSVTAIALNGISDSSDVITKTTKSPAPTGLSAIVSDDGHVALRWNDVAGEQGYIIERSSSSDDWSSVGTASADVTSFMDASAVGGQSYSYRVGAASATDDYSYSSSLQVAIVPSAPNNLQASAFMSGSINLSWTDNSNNESSFTIEQSTNGLTFATLMVLGANVTSHTVSGLTDGSTYSFRVFASNGAGSSARSNIVTKTSGVADIPNAPTNLRYDSASDTLLFDDNSPNDPHEQIIVEALPSVAYHLLDSDQTKESNWRDVAEYLDGHDSAFQRPVEWGTNIEDTYRIYAWNSAGRSEYSNTITVGSEHTTLNVNSYYYSDSYGLSELYGFNPIVTSTSVHLFWTDDYVTEIGYKLFRSTNVDALSGDLSLSTVSSDATLIATLPADTGTSYLDTGLTSGTTYYYRILSEEAINDTPLSVTTPGMSPNDIQLIAHRTGENFGNTVSDAVKQSGDPSQYVILTNNNYDEDPTDTTKDYDNDTALVPNGGSSSADHDLAEITLKALPSGLASGTAQITLSDPSNVRLFKSDGTELTTSEMSLDLADPSGYLAGLTSGDVDVWVEGLHSNSDFVFKYSYSDNTGKEISRDTVHMLIADWNFVGDNGLPVTNVGNFDESDLMNHASGDPNEPMPDYEIYFKAYINGLPTADVEQLRGTSGSNSSDYFDDDFGTSDVATESSDFALLYSSGASVESLDDSERSILKSTLQLNAVHNDQALYRLATKGGDAFERKIDLKQGSYDTATLRAALIADPTYGDAVKFVLDAMDNAVDDQGHKRFEFSVEWLLGRDFDGTARGVYVDSGAPDLATAKEWAMNALREWASDNLDIKIAVTDDRYNFFGKLARKWARHFYYDDNGNPLANPDPDAPVTSLASTLDFLYLFSRDATTPSYSKNSEMYASSDDDDLFGNDVPQIFMWVFANRQGFTPLFMNETNAKVNIPSKIGTTGGLNMDYWEWDTTRSSHPWSTDHPLPEASGPGAGSYPFEDQTHHFAAYFALGAFYGDTDTGLMGDTGIGVTNLKSALKQSGDYPGPVGPSATATPSDKGDYYLGVVAADLGAEYRKNPSAMGSVIAQRLKLSYVAAKAAAGRTTDP